MSQELVSIIIPVYRAEAYLRKCLDSIVSQTYTALEIINVNDGSPDACIEILNEYAGRDGRFIIIDKENEGVSAARNDGLKVASGKYIAFVDADDWIDQRTIEMAVNAIKKTQSDVVIWSYVSERSNRSVEKHIFDSNKTFENIEVRSKLYRRFIGLLDEELAHPELADSLCPVWGKLYTKELLEGRQFIDLKEIGTYEDGLFNLEVFAQVKKAAYLDRALYHYRRAGGDSQTSPYRPKLFKQWQKLFDRMQEHIDVNNLPMEFERALFNRIALSIIGLGFNQCNSSQGTVSNRKAICSIITSPRYKKAYDQLVLKWFPIHWKTFFWMCKHEYAEGVYSLLLIMRWLKKR